jgi:ankyrin repeat protein
VKDTLSEEERRTDSQKHWFHNPLAQKSVIIITHIYLCLRPSILLSSGQCYNKEYENNPSVAITSQHTYHTGAIVEPLPVPLTERFHLLVFIPEYLCSKMEEKKFTLGSWRVPEKAPPGWTDLHQAALLFALDEDKMKELTEHVNVGFFDWHNVRPIHVAVYANNLKAVELLQKYGADLRSKTYPGEETGLRGKLIRTYAFVPNHVVTFIDKEFPKNHVKLPNENLTPLELAKALGKRDEIVSFLERHAAGTDEKK